MTPLRCAHIVAETSWNGNDLVQWVNHQHWKCNKDTYTRESRNLFPSLLNIIPLGQAPISWYWVCYSSQSKGWLGWPVSTLWGRTEAEWHTVACFLRTRFWTFCFSCQWFLSSFGVIWTDLPWSPTQVCPGAPSPSPSLQRVTSLQDATQTPLSYFPSFPSPTPC